jgi:serine/threonine protein kinase
MVDASQHGRANERNADDFSAANSADVLSDAESLALQLADEMGERWRRGERPCAEDFLARYPRLRQQPQAAVRLVYEEICLRDDVGEQMSADEFMRRFPEWRDEIQVLLECHQLVQPASATARMPEVGESLGPLRLLAELGRGALGRVFLAEEPQLAGRLVVVKVTPSDGREHLLLSRLQHTHIVPLLFIFDDAERILRSFGMPYLGGATLAEVLARLSQPSARPRKGNDILAALDKMKPPHAAHIPASGPVRRFIGCHSYVDTICWMAACLADALEHVHQRGLVHLDLKPSNVLVAPDGQPMLLDFHLAREPVARSETVVGHFGGTPDYMSPEQQRVLSAVREGRRAPTAVDARSDVYSLGMILYEALGGKNHGTKETKGTNELQGAVESWPCLFQVNPDVSVGLSDIVQKCLARDPNDRYATAADVAADLRCHLNAMPLIGAGNRSWKERWNKWRRRQPFSLAIIALVVAIAVAAVGAGHYGWTYVGRQVQRAQDDLAEGQQRQREGDYAEAARVLQNGLEAASGVAGHAELKRELDAELRRANQLQLAKQLHSLADQLRLSYGFEELTAERQRQLSQYCRTVWETREALLATCSSPADLKIAETMKADLLDVGILWADLRGRASNDDQSHREALRILEQVEALSSPSLVLYLERGRYAEALGMAAEAREAQQRASQLTAGTSWEQLALGRALLRDGQLELALAHFQQAADLEPHNFWPHYYQAVCAFRLGRYDEALQTLRVCIALAPERPECFYNRAVVELAQSDHNAARASLQRALQRDPRYQPARDLLARLPADR